jgi:hypothetical protein
VVSPVVAADLSPNVQGIVVRRADLITAGVPRWRVDRQVDAGRWRQLNHLVLCTHNGPLTVAQQRTAVLLSAPLPAALCAETALSEWGLRGFPADVVQILVPRGAQVLDVPGVNVRVHESRRFTAADQRWLRDLLVTGIERSVIDAASWTGRDLDAARLLAAAVQQRVTTAQRLGAELDQAGKIRRCKLLRTLLNDMAGGAEALSEVEAIRFCRRHGFDYVDSSVRSDVNGRRRYLDLRLRRTDGSIQLVEVDGGVHLQLATRLLDNLKDNDAVLAGERILRYSSVAFYTDDPRVVAQLGRALGVVRP